MRVKPPKPVVNKKSSFRILKTLRSIFFWFGGIILLVIFSSLYLFITPEGDSSMEYEERVRDKSIYLSHLMVSFSPRLHYEALKGEIPVIIGAYECVSSSGINCSEKSSDFNDVSLRIKSTVAVIILILVKIFAISQFFVFIGKEIYTIYKGSKNEYKK